MFNFNFDDSFLKLFPLKVSNIGGLITNVNIKIHDITDLKQQSNALRLFKGSYVFIYNNNLLVKHARLTISVRK